MKTLKSVLNDQAPKPKLGNSSSLHGKTSTDMPGLREPSRNRPIVTNSKVKK